MNQFNKAMQSVGVGGGLGVVIAFFWDMFFPETPMPAEVAAALAGILAALANLVMPANAPAK